MINLNTKVKVKKALYGVRLVPSKHGSLEAECVKLPHKPDLLIIHPFGFLRCPVVG